MWSKCAAEGGNSGIGKQTAKALASLGAQVIIAARDIQKGEDAVKDIACPEGKVSFIPLDLACFQSIYSFAEVRNVVGQTFLLLLNCWHIEPASITIPSDLKMQTFLKRSQTENWDPLSILVLNAGVFPIGGHQYCEKGYEHCFSTK